MMKNPIGTFGIHPIYCIEERRGYDLLSVNNGNLTGDRYEHKLHLIIAHDPKRGYISFETTDVKIVEADTEITYKVEPVTISEMCMIDDVFVTEVSCNILNKRYVALKYSLVTVTRSRFQRIDLV
jgi:hypothetical protein